MDEQFRRAPYMTAVEAGSFLGLPARTLERFRLEGRGPAFLKLGRRVVYARADLVAWAESHRRTSTSDNGSGGTGSRPARP